MTRVDPDIFDLADWGLRYRSFTALGTYDDGGERAVIAMELAPPADTDAAGWKKLRELWLGLHTHPNVLDALDMAGERLLVRYAPLHWQHRRGVVENTDGELRRRATWGVQLADAFGSITETVPSRFYGLLTNPLVAIDLARQIRIGFLPPSPDAEPGSTQIAPELAVTWPAADERALVHLVGTVLGEWWLNVPPDDTYPLARAVRRAVNPDPARRHQTLRELYDAFVLAGGDAGSIRRGDRLAAWTAAEAGAGMLAVGRHEDAMELFAEALALDEHCVLADFARDRVRERISRRTEPPPTLRWSDIAAAALSLEASRAFEPALAAYRRVAPDTAPGSELQLALARCHLAIGDTGHAIDFARCAHALEPGRVDAAAIEVRARLVRGEPAEALTRIDAVVLAHADDAGAHYLRGKCLFALRRLVEARDVFELALALRPTMVQAMLLRREADRMLRGVRTATGAGDRQPTSGPDHLASIRALVLDGRTADAIVELSRPAHATDPAAWLMLADCLLSEGRGEEALDVYVRIAHIGGEAREAAVVGTGRALLALGRDGEALELFDHALRVSPGDLQALEGRVRALEALGRADEAEAAHRDLTAACAARSDVRLRTR